MVDDKNPCVNDSWRIPDALWEWVEPLLPREGPKPKGGKPRASARDFVGSIYQAYKYERGLTMNSQSAMLVGVRAVLGCTLRDFERSETFLGRHVDVMRRVTGP